MIDAHGFSVAALRRIAYFVAFLIPLISGFAGVRVNSHRLIFLALHASLPAFPADRSGLMSSFFSLS